MNRELWDVQERCEECGSVTRALVHDWWLDDDGHECESVYVERVPHGHSECARMLALQREEWPTLW